jgi:hypothetical protein
MIKSMLAIGVVLAFSSGAAKALEIESDTCKVPASQTTGFVASGGKNATGGGVSGSSASSDAGRGNGGDTRTVELVDETLIVTCDVLETEDEDQDPGFPNRLFPN